MGYGAIRPLGTLDHFNALIARVGPGLGTARTGGEPTFGTRPGRDRMIANVPGFGGFGVLEPQAAQGKIAHGHLYPGCFKSLPVATDGHCASFPRFRVGTYGLDASRLFYFPT